MSTSSNQDPRLTQSAASDTSLLAAHEKAAGKQADEMGNYKLLPLALLFGFSGLIFWAGTYLNRFSGQFSGKIFDENSVPSTGAEVVAKIDPIILGELRIGIDLLPSSACRKRLETWFESGVGRITCLDWTAETGPLG